MNNEKNKKIWVEKCEENLKMRGRSSVTIRNYKYSIIKFLNHFDSNTNIKKISNDDLLLYFKENIIDKGLSSNTFNFELSAIRLFFSICFERELNRKLLPTTKLRKRYPTIITKEQFIDIINRENNIKHKCWLLLSFCCGLRISEISTLKIENINSKEHKLKILGKGNKERYTILPDIVIKYLRMYYKNKNLTDNNGYLFKGTDNQPHISPNTIGNYFTNLKREFNLPNELTEHSLRHAFATYFLMNGGDLLVLKEMLGHRNIVSTTIYIHMAQDFNNLKGIRYV